MFYIIKEWFFYLNHFSLIIFYHSLWFGFELFGLRVQVCCQLVQFTLARKGYDNHHCHNKPQRGNDLECGWRRAQKKWAKNLEDFEKDSVEVRTWCWEVGSDLGAEKLKSDHAVEGWHWTTDAANWASAVGAENGALSHRVEFSTVETKVKFIESLQAKMNWDLKHHDMCRMRNCLSPRVEEPKSEVNKTVRTWTTESACICVLYLRVLWLWLRSLGLYNKCSKLTRKEYKIRHDWVGKVNHW